MDERELLEGRLRELSRISYERDIPRHTDFLSLSEQSVFYDMDRRDIASNSVLEGGYEEAERRIVFFLPEYADAASEAEDAISLIKVEPLNLKFSDVLTHRDFLGALMNLGIDRSKTGDIITAKDKTYIFCLREVEELICSELLRVKHTSVRAEAVALSECDIRPELKDMSVNVASERADAVIAAVFKLSRNVSQTLIASESVFSDGRVLRQPSASLKEGARVSVRGHGKFIFGGISGNTKKGRLYVDIRRYV
ncbi:MAG: YlmH/Sll1252 family protein [Candidatus Avilachnospira sp.]|jgi:RNA-binding protein YlmH